MSEYLSARLCKQSTEVKVGTELFFAILRLVVGRSDKNVCDHFDHCLCLVKTSTVYTSHQWRLVICRQKIWCADRVRTNHFSITVCSIYWEKWHLRCFCLCVRVCSKYLYIKYCFMSVCLFLEQLNIFVSDNVRCP